MRVLAIVVLALLARDGQEAPGAPAPAPAPTRRVTTRYDDYFRKYSKRYFGPTFDWHYFKAQAMAESNLDPKARSRVGARGLMQLMPSTYALIASSSSHYKEINDPQSNIGAGIAHDRDLWMMWNEKVTDADRFAFMFGTYNAGEGAIIRARARAQKSKLDPQQWQSVVVIAPKVPRWRYRETLGYVTTIQGNYTYLSPVVFAPTPVAVATPP
jgi:membrane-bound lytic murein transglycosylase F